MTGAPAVLGRSRTFPPNTHGIDTAWCQREERFETNIAFPGGAEVVDMAEPLAPMEAEVPQPDTARWCPAAAVFSAMNMETMQMLVTPGK